MSAPHSYPWEYTEEKRARLAEQSRYNWIRYWSKDETPSAPRRVGWGSSWGEPGLFKRAIRALGAGRGVPDKLVIGGYTYNRDRRRKRA